MEQSKTKLAKHVPVLLQEVLETLAPKPGEFFVDGTAGGGGHLQEIIKRLEPGGMVLAVDRDLKAVARLEQILEDQPANLKKTLVVAGNYSDLPEILKQNSLPKVDGILLDLGMSSDQIEDLERGFGFNSLGELSMTYDDSGVPVSELIRKLSEKELVNALKTFGQEKYAKRIAREIKANLPIQTASELAQLIKNLFGSGYERGRIHPATRTFMALRIMANDELGHLEKFLETVEELLSEKGRVGIMSFHSLEDRMVKQWMKQMVKSKNFEWVQEEFIQPTLQEESENPRSRSAKLRVIQKI
ncbi:MAG: 16S rRNA (cytosine(1402)-N(4))-methyltransferase [Candidatus Harrisonbacteria bacterium CG10_big_fil_rev_8_21_14_0_10_44_23]|uniref:Ribosomal RNA small subunit methyltransferase H n=1 Tax=Candidatus Harrisonbacteria bacterium CG10_big_fil_rev_8_21_14_0_10_44_23 TaxID=1974585 RepID=A0A2H0UQ30_9BACT|nr:MAG: 16S rRNA (cytosine(1402)-N(4))-methyltransferase [Candidatus Harrisonbacteria bacterium CG10_big_fil_rev_8_21_14_0_10_44_23]